VGYQVRFADKSSITVSIKLMTDGILLAETQREPRLRAYDTRIITSATIDAQRFAEHFAINGKVAPVIEVSGRLFPVEQRCAPLESDIKPDSNKRIKDC